ncbi:MAG: peroxiredoxin-like family protein, partial [Bacteroidota bacterium]
VTAESLKTALDTKKEEWRAKASDEIKRIYTEGIASVEASDLWQSVLKEGDVAIDFELINATGKSVSLRETLKNGPVILTWYRGGWCPYCNLTLQYLQRVLPQFQAEGATLIALTPEVPDKSLSTKEKHQLAFEVLSDLDNNVARSYGIIFKLTEEVAEKYQNAFDLAAYNGNEDAELPLAATYVIGQDQIIKYAFLDAEYRNRAEPEAILKVLQAL